MKLKALGGAAVAVAAIYALVTYGLPAYQERGGQDDDPNHVVLNVNWSTSGGVEQATVVWRVIGTDDGGTQTAVGGHWRRDIHLQGKGTHLISLSAVPTAVKVKDGKGGTFMKSATSTCAVIHLGATKRHTRPPTVGQGCHVETAVVIK